MVPTTCETDSRAVRCAHAGLQLDRRVRRPARAVRRHRHLPLRPVASRTLRQPPPRARRGLWWRPQPAVLSDTGVRGLRDRRGSRCGRGCARARRAIVAGGGGSRGSRPRGKARRAAVVRAVDGRRRLQRCPALRARPGALRRDGERDVARPRARWALLRAPRLEHRPRVQGGGGGRARPPPRRLRALRRGRAHAARRDSAPRRHAAGSDQDHQRAEPALRGGVKR